MSMSELSQGFEQPLGSSLGTSNEAAVDDDATPRRVAIQQRCQAWLTPTPVLGLSQGFEQPLRSSLGTSIEVSTLDELNNGAMMLHIVSLLRRPPRVMPGVHHAMKDGPSIVLHAKC
jgi:hypothetical protein